MQRSAVAIILPVMLALTGAMFSSCSNNDDLPDVTVSIDYAGAAWHDGMFYLTPSDTLRIEAVNVESNVPDLQATIGAVSYYWNYMLLGTAINPPFGMQIPGDAMTPATYVMQLTATVYQTEKAIGIFYITLPVTIVAEPEDIPEEYERGGRFIPTDTDMRSGVSPTV